MSMNDYILESEKLRREISLHNMGLPDTVQAFKTLEEAMITYNQRQMALTFGSDLSFKSMKTTLQHIFGEISYMNASNEEISSSSILYSLKEI